MATNANKLALAVGLGGNDMSKQYFTSLHVPRSDLDTRAFSWLGPYSKLHQRFGDHFVKLRRGRNKDCAEVCIAQQVLMVKCMEKRLKQDFQWTAIDHIGPFDDYCRSAFGDVFVMVYTSACLPTQQERDLLYKVYRAARLTAIGRDRRMVLYPCEQEYMQTSQKVGHIKIFDEIARGQGWPRPITCYSRPCQLCGKKCVYKRGNSSGGAHVLEVLEGAQYYLTCGHKNHCPHCHQDEQYTVHSNTRSRKRANSVPHSTSKSRKRATPTPHLNARPRESAHAAPTDLAPTDPTPRRNTLFDGQWFHQEYVPSIKRHGEIAYFVVAKDGPQGIEGEIVYKPCVMKREKDTLNFVALQDDSLKKFTHWSEEMVREWVLIHYCLLARHPEFVRDNPSILIGRRMDISFLDGHPWLNESNPPWLAAAFLKHTSGSAYAEVIEPWAKRTVSLLGREDWVRLGGLEPTNSKAVPRLMVDKSTLTDEGNSLRRDVEVMFKQIEGICTSQITEGIERIDNSAKAVLEQIGECFKSHSTRSTRTGRSDHSLTNDRETITEGGTAVHAYPRGHTKRSAELLRDFDEVSDEAVMQALMDRRLASL